MGKESSSITGTFGKIGRRLLLTAFVSAVALSTDAQPAFQADSAKTDTASLPPPGKAAEHNYLRMFQAVSNGYSARLDSLEEYLTGYLQRNDTSVHKGVIIMDPLKFDVARALGYTTKEAVVMLLEEKGALYKTVTNMGAVAENMELSFSSQYGDMTYTQSPISIVNLYNISQPSRIAVIIPMPQHAMPFNVPGMKNDVLLEYIDRHEGWHVLDVLTSFIGIDASYMNSDSSRLVFSNGALLRSSHAREFASRKLKQESLADVGALGDMIHAGHGPAIIEQVMRWREKSAAVDGWHMTAPALERLQKKLAETGLEEFKKMNEKERRDFYMDIVEKSCPTAEGVKIMMTYHKCDNDAKLALLEKSKTDAETRKAIALARALSGIVRVPDLPMTIEETEAVRQKTREKIRQDLDKWDPLKDLQKTARKNDKVVTMESVVRAYGSMMEDLRDKIARQPGKEELYREKMTRLQNTFVTYFACIDFDMTATPKLPRVSVPIKTVF